VGREIESLIAGELVMKENSSGNHLSGYVQLHR